MSHRTILGLVMVVISGMGACAEPGMLTPPPAGPSSGESSMRASPEPSTAPPPSTAVAATAPSASVTAPPVAPQAPPRAVTPPDSFVRLDGEIRKAFEPSKKHKYKGTVEDVLGKGSDLKGRYGENAEEADRWDQALEALVAGGTKPDWTPVVLARQGAVFDVLRDGLFQTPLASLAYFTPAQEGQLKALENSGRPELADKAAELRDKVKSGAEQKKEKALDATSSQMVRRYASAVALAQKTNVRHPLVDQATARLAYYTGILGEAKMREYVTSTPDPSDPSKKLTYTAGQYAHTPTP